MNVAPEPSDVDVPLGLLPCQYQVNPLVGVPVLLIVTGPHWGELLVGFGGATGADTVTFRLVLDTLQQPALFLALR